MITMVHFYHKTEPYFILSGIDLRRRGRIYSLLPGRADRKMYCLETYYGEGMAGHRSDPAPNSHVSADLALPYLVILRSGNILRSTSPSP